METCDCSDYHWTCSANDNVTEPSRWITNTTDILFDIGDYDINEWILQTYNNFISTRFGGWSTYFQSQSEFDSNNEDAKNNLSSKDWITGAPKKLIAWYNNDNRAFHALPSYTSAIHNAMLRSLVGNGEASSYGISTFSHPLSIFSGQIDSQTL